MRRDRRCSASSTLWGKQSACLRKASRNWRRPGDALATPWRQDSSPSMRCCQTAMGTQPPTCFPWSQFKAPSPPKCSRPTSTGGPSSKARDTILAGGGGPQPLKDKGKEEPSSRRGRRQWKRPRQGQSKGGSWQAKGDASSWRENKTDSWAGLCRGHWNWRMESVFFIAWLASALVFRLRTLL